MSEPERMPFERSLLDEATVNSNIPGYGARLYKGITERAFKDRYKEHKKTFNNRRYENDSELSKEIWQIKDAGGVPEIKWKVVRKTRTYNPNTKTCMLCLSEKLSIAEHVGRDLLNKRSEIIAKCRHQTKYCLSQIDSKD